MSMPPVKNFKRFNAASLLAQGIEPFPEIHRRAVALGADEGLLVLAPFLPSPLIERLQGEGFVSKVERGSGTDWLVYFWREVG